MFDSVILDVAVALVFLFMAVSLATSAAVEAIASALKLRSTTLKQGVMDLMNDPKFENLAAALYAHALINPRGPGQASACLKQGTTGQDPPSTPSTVLEILHGSSSSEKAILKKRLETNLPAYIQPKQFADALADVLSLTGSAEGVLPRADQLIDLINQKVPAADNPQINQLLCGIVTRTSGDLAAIRAEIASWFDNSMDRVSGVYKRHTQLISFAVALIISMLINADAIQMAQRVWEQPALISMLKLSPTPQTTLEANPALVKTLPLGWAGGGVGYVLDKADKAGNENGILMPLPSVPMALIGWCITAFATLFGAPFWFDALQQIIRLKGSGPSPAEKTSGAAAAS